MKLIRKMSLALIVLAAVGCAHSLKHGTVAMKTGDNIAHLSIHGVKPGDSVVLYRNVCPGSGGGPGESRRCHREKISDGKITSVLSDHYSEAQFPAGIKFAEGDFVETVR